MEIGRIFKAAALIFVATAFGTAFKFVANLVAAKTLPLADYGAFSFIFSTAFILSSLASFGFVYVVLRFVPAYLAEGRKEKAGNAVASSLAVTLATGTVFALGLFALAPWVSQTFLHTPAYADAIKFFSLAVPFFSALMLASNFFQSLGATKEKALSFDLAPNALQMAFFITAAAFGAGLWAFLGLQLAAILAALALAALLALKKLREFDFTSIAPEAVWVAFAAPLFAQDVLGMVVNWADVFLLGYFGTPEQIGIYYAASRVATVLGLFLGTVGFLYTSQASAAFARKDIGEVARAFRTIVKWLSFATTPVFIVVFLFPNAVLNIVYGPQFASAAGALSILAVGYFVFTITGPNGSTLIMFGRSKLVFATVLVSAIANVLLNVLLIPGMGLIGAAIASAGSIVLLKLVAGVELYRRYGISPFSKKTLLAIFASLGLVGVFYALVKTPTGWLQPNVPLLAGLFTVYLASYAVLMFKLGEFDEDDWRMLHVVRDKAKNLYAQARDVLAKW